MITLDEGLDIARRIEQAIIPAGYHCALGGSVLHSGQSGKDLDIFIYPHNGKVLNSALLRLKLKAAGFVCYFVPGTSKKSVDSKAIELWSFGKIRIDFFFLQ